MYCLVNHVTSFPQCCQRFDRICQCPRSTCVERWTSGRGARVAEMMKQHVDSGWASRGATSTIKHRNVRLMCLRVPIRDVEEKSVFWWQKNNLRLWLGSLKTRDSSWFETRDSNYSSECIFIVSSLVVLHLAVSVSLFERDEDKDFKDLYRLVTLPRRGKKATWLVTRLVPTRNKLGLLWDSDYMTWVTRLQLTCSGRRRTKHTCSEAF